MTTIDISVPNQTLRGPGGIRLVLDASEIIPEDPGQGTPAVVECGVGSGTFWAAADNGELICGPREVTLSDSQCEWLSGLYDQVGDWLSHHTERATAPTH